MGQYWEVVNLDKREYINVGQNAKLWEKLANHPGDGAGLIVLLAAMPEPRGGGDLKGDTEDPQYNEIARRTIGRWAGDRIAIVGDYAKRGDLQDSEHAEMIYALCCSEKQYQEYVEDLRKSIQKGSEDPERLARWNVALFDMEREYNARGLFRDITADVIQVINHELRVVGKKVPT